MCLAGTLHHSKFNYTWDYAKHFSVGSSSILESLSSGTPDRTHQMWSADVHFLIMRMYTYHSYIACKLVNFLARLTHNLLELQDLSAVNVTSQSQANRVNRNAYKCSVVMLVLFIYK